MVRQRGSPTGSQPARDGNLRRRTAPTIDDIDPIRHLGVHEAVCPDTGTAGRPQLTEYVQRAHDDRLRSVLRTARGDTVLLLLGGSSTGKSRACYEALRAVFPGRPVMRPADGNDLLALLEFDPEPGAVLWLDDAHLFLHGPRGADVARALHLMLDADPRPGPNRVVIGGMWSHELRRSAGDDRGQAVHELLTRRGVTVALCEDFERPEDVGRAAARDPRWHIALTADDGADVVQYLTGGPYLVQYYDEGRYGADAHALLTAAMDAHRVGFWSPLRPDLLAEAASGYLPLRHDATAVGRALPHAMRPVRGVRALAPAAGLDGAVVLHSYLAQHARGARRRQPVPDSLWAALTRGVDDGGDSDRVVGSVLVRGLPGWALPLLRRRADAGDGGAARRLAGLLHSRGDPEAVAELRARAGAGCRAAADLLIEQNDPMAMELLRGRADAGDGVAAVRLAELLFQRGGSAARAQLRDRADAGDDDAARRLAELLFADGGRDAVGELRVRAERGDRHASELLVELLAGWRDAEAVAELRERAADGDVHAATRLVEVLSERGGPAEVAELRTRADGGDRYGAVHLIGILYQRGDADAAAELRERAADGDRSAAQLLARLLFQRGDEDSAAELRERAGAGHRGAAEQLCTLLRERGDVESLHELRDRAGAGDWYAAGVLVELLAERGDHDAVLELRAIARSGDGFATEILVGMGDPVAIELMRARAHRGDPEAVDVLVERVDPGDAAALADLRAFAAAGSGYAAERLIRVLSDLGDDSAVADLRAHADAGDGYAAEMLVRLLFGRGDRKAVDELRARSDLGDRLAGTRLVELLAARQDRDAEAELRVRADGGDQYAGKHLAGVLAGRGDPAALAELRTRADIGDRCAGERLIELLVGCGDPDAVSELQARADSGEPGAAAALAGILLARGDERGLRAEVNAGNTDDAAHALALLLAGR
jgi:hypothetical protein